MAGKIAEHFVLEYRQPCNHVNNYHKHTANVSYSKAKSTEEEVKHKLAYIFGNLFPKRIRGEAQNGKHTEFRRMNEGLNHLSQRLGREHTLTHINDLKHIHVFSLLSV